MHHQRNTRAQIWGGWILRSNVGSIHHVTLRNSTPAVKFAAALTEIPPPPPGFPNIFLLVTTENILIIKVIRHDARALYVYVCRLPKSSIQPTGKIGC